MTSAAPDSPSIAQTDHCRSIIDYWRVLRGARMAPLRGDFDPAEVPRHLPHVAIFEVLGPELTLCRLAGTAWRRSLGFELTGKNVVHLYAAELHRAAGWRMGTAATHPCGAILELNLRFSTGAEMRHEVVILPLEPDSPENPPLLLVAFAAFGDLYWHNTVVIPHLSPSSTFRFFDIGAGTPESTFPADWTYE